MDEMREQVLAWLQTKPQGPFRAEDIARALGLPASARTRIKRQLRELAVAGELARFKGHSYAIPAQSTTVAGILRTSTKGFGFVVPESQFISGGDRREIFVPRKRMADALHNDKVLVRIVSDSGKSPEGQILRVVERGTRELVGTFYHTKRGGTVIPRDEKVGRSIHTPRPPAEMNLSDGDYVLVEITGWPSATEPLLGRVTEALGEPGTPGIDVTIVIRDAGVEPAFPPGVLEEADALPAEIPAHEIARRTDFRHHTTFTIDGPHAKDFDDALSVSRLPDGRWLLGVHIADVAHYVAENSAIDTEARDRATSIYPVDRVVPMLPEKLSNGLCSLRPGEERLTMSVIMEVDHDGHVGRYSIHDGVIRSSHRLVYEDVQALMDGTAPPDVVRSIGDVRPFLEDLYALRRVLTKMRLRRGALDLDVAETEVVMNDKHETVGIVRRPRLESHRVVEECMLLANEVVAAHLFNLQVPSVYRVHEPPDLAKLRNLLPVLAHLNVRFPARRDITPDAIQIALDSAAASETGFIARRLILRAMMRAHYRDENLGHYGLASTCYTHFTSPIRRYPDLIVHRLLKETIAGGAPANGVYNPPSHAVPVLSARIAPEAGAAETAGGLARERTALLRRNLGPWTRHCSERERRAEEIENCATTVKSLEFMRRFLGDQFEGYITSVVNWGVFVELREFPVEGLVHIHSLEDDFYEYDEEHMILTGKHTGRSLRLGAPVRVAIESVNVATMELNLALIELLREKGDDGDLSKRRKERLDRERRHKERRPRTGGFQSRMKRRRR